MNIAGDFRAAVRVLMRAPFVPLVVGVVSDVRRPLSQDPRAEAVMYFSYQRVAYAVAQRAKECAVRQAVGATVSRVADEQHVRSRGRRVSSSTRRARTERLA